MRDYLPICLLALLSPCTPVRAQSADLLDRARHNALSYMHDLPDFLCTETVERLENRGDRKWKRKDVLRVEVGFSAGEEYARLTALNGRATRRSIESLNGSLSEGEFGGLLAEVFRAATFGPGSRETVGDRQAARFLYTVTAANSNYHLEFGSENGRERRLVVAHHGSVFIDVEDARVLRIEQIADMPAGSPLSATDTLIEYDWSEVAGVRYLLPGHARVTMKIGELTTRNEIGFGNYRKFAAESKLTASEPIP